MNIAADDSPVSARAPRSVLITGGGSGIGAATAMRLVRSGAFVTISGRRADALQRVADEAGPRCLAVSGDITRAEDRTAMVEAAVRHGGGLTGLVNNAANMLRGPITGLDEAAVMELFHTNVVAAMMLTGLAAPHLEKGGGAVLFVGSVHTRRAYPGASPYAATKGAVEVLTRVLAGELGPRGIRVNCVVPGAVPTELNIRAGLFTAEQSAQRMAGLAKEHALQRIGQPDEVAQAIAHLLEAEWTTGAVLAVDGGLSLGLSSF